MEYSDTSLLVSALSSNEAASGRSQVWLATQEPGSVAISDWTITEFSSALSIKTRMNVIDQTRQALAIATFNTLVEQSFVLLPIQREHFRLAAAFAGDPNNGLRSGDALHLAVASLAGLRLRSLDTRLTSAARMLGCAADLV